MNHPVSSIRARITALILIACIVLFSLTTISFVIQLKNMKKLTFDSSSRVLIDSAKVMMTRSSNQQAHYVELKMASLADEVRVLSTAAEASYARPKPWTPSRLPFNIVKDIRGEYYGEYRPAKDGDLFISGKNQLTPEILDDAAALDELTPILMKISQQHPEIVYAYVVTRNSVVRGFPAPVTIQDAIDAGFLDPYSDFREAPFYATADAKNNPKREAKWTDLYLDPGGSGWMFTACSPVYAGDELKAVAGLDITMDQVAGSILDLKVGNSGYAFLASRDGTVLGYPSAAAKEIGWHKGMKPDALNLLKIKNNPFGQILKKMKSGSSVFERVLVNSKPAYVYMHAVKSTPFVISLVLSEDELLSELSLAEKSINNSAAIMLIQMIIISLAILLACLAFALYSSRLLTKPVIELTAKSSLVAKGQFDQVIETTSSDEIGILARSFNKMVEAVKSREHEQHRLAEELKAQNELLDNKNRQLTHMLGKLTESEADLQHFQALSYTDDLTGAFNRRYIEEHLQGELSSRRKNSPSYACILLDIDEFKNINDKYGHLAGDLVLQDTARILMETKRMHDVAARFGGDEFIVLMEQVSSADVLEIAERIRVEVESHAFKFNDQEIRTTISMGLTTVATGEEKNSHEVIHEADKALYEAKNAGGNRIIVSRVKVDSASSKK